MVTQRRYSLRRHVWRVVALIALIPLLFVALGVPFDHFVRWRLQDRVDDSTASCIEALRSGKQCAKTANSHHTWVRVFRDGELVEEADSASVASVSWLEGLMEPESPTWLREHDPLRGDQPSTGCEVVAFDRLLVCHRERSVNVGGAEFEVAAVSGDVRSVRALSLDGVTKLALQVLVVALIVGWWLGRRIVLPMEELRRRVLARRGTEEYEPIPTDDETEVGEVAAAFNELLTEVEERRRENEAFAADLAHDLQTPIATVLSCAENIDGVDLTPEQARRHAAVLRRSGERLNGVVSDFLELARAEAGLEHAAREPVDVADLLEAVVAELTERREFESRHVRLDAGTGTVTGSPRYLETAFENVIVNALQVVGEGGDVEVTATLVDDDVVVTVRDDGPGIREADLPRVFDRFFTRRGGGTGLGLPMARAIARAHRGELTVRSARGVGSTFVFRFPSHERHTEMTDE